MNTTLLICVFLMSASMCTGLYGFLMSFLAPGRNNEVAGMRIGRWLLLAAFLSAFAAHFFRAPITP